MAHSSTQTCSNAADARCCASGERRAASTPRAPLFARLSPRCHSPAAITPTATRRRRRRLQTPLFQQRNYAGAIENIVKRTAEAAHEKQGQAIGPSAGGREQPRQPTYPGGDSGGGGKSASGFKMPPMWVWLLLLCVVVPLLLCCCCIYCCCCRGKGGASAGAAERRPVPGDDPDAPVPTTGGGGGLAGLGGLGDRARGFLGGAGGGMAMGAIQNFFNRRGGGGGGGGMPPDVPMSGVGGGGGGGVPGDHGSYVPPQPVVVEEGKGERHSRSDRCTPQALVAGLYPSVRVEDKGAGGGW